jgi:TPR repeat protein
MRRICALVCGIAFLITTSVAAATLTPNHSQEELAVMATRAYLAGHPDLRWRNEGLDALAQGKPSEALEHLLRAARYADKASQALIAQQHWRGQGVGRDRAMAYAWMDLAAERLYPGYLALRERYWNALDTQERERALQLGFEVYAEYGDAVAKSRLEAVLRRHRGSRTGSRTGADLGAEAYTGNIPGAGMTGSASVIPVRTLAERRYWHPAAYWAWQDEAYQSLRAPKVRVLELKPRSERIR